MVDLKRLTIALAATKTSSNSNSMVKKSSRSFNRDDELVGLGIVAAMSTCTSTTTTDHHLLPETKTTSTMINNQIRTASKLLSVAVAKPMIGGTKSIPIQSSSGAGTAVGLGFGFGDERVGGGSGGFEDEIMMEMDMTESYTCVVSQIGNDRVSTREYFDDRLVSGNSSIRSTGVISRGVFSRSLMEVVENEEAPFWGGADFLSSCFLCGKDLRGIDIFMYRGEKAFCSVECREVQVATDKHKLKEKHGHGHGRGRGHVRSSMEHSESPCCSPMLSYTGVVAA